MQQSNTYIIVYSAVLTIILGLLLSGSAQVLGPWQQEAIALDKKKQIFVAGRIDESSFNLGNTSQNKSR